ncbi:hypothetical protein, partial [Thalassospira profundimaris]|uniref:hypothetical protein n=1 Tax=Thalassospira profundimaris TaxID=502049 RepID=UPI0039EA8E5C
MNSPGSGQFWPFLQKCLFLTFFLKKGFDSFGSGPYNPPPPTGCGANETATRTERFGASAFEFFDIVDQKEGM